MGFIGEGGGGTGDIPYTLDEVIKYIYSVFLCYLSYPSFTNSLFPRCAMAANLVHCGTESGPKQNHGCWGYREKKNSKT